MRILGARLSHEFPTAEALKIKILEESEVRTQSAVVEAASALATKQGGRRKPRRRREKMEHKNSIEDASKVVCYKCGKPGHKSPDSPDVSSGPSDKPKRKSTSYTLAKPIASAADDTWLTTLPSTIAARFRANP